MYIHVSMATDVDLVACAGCHCLAARKQARAITRLFEEKLRRHGLRATQFSVLAALALKGPTPVRELADVLGLERTTLTRVGALLERNGWVSTAPSAEDARQHPFRLTAVGRRKLTAAFPAWKEAQELVESRLPGSPRAYETARGRPRASGGSVDRSVDRRAHAETEKE